MGEVLTLEAARQFRQEARSRRELVVFTNGCFDLLHLGHVEYLEQAAAMGDHLIVALNNDRSVRAIKGPDRPVVGEVHRSRVVASLACVDCVVLFDEPTPERLISSLEPDVLVKGGDWPREKIVGGSLVESWGGRVVSIESSVPECSSSGLIDRIKSAGARPAPGEDDGSMWNYLHDSAQVVLESGSQLLDGVTRAGESLVSRLAAGGKVFLCGNGGSAW
jgi:rfaE bifunctional protein nucleotidyltransferase chain/domain